jgi:hypothetical protein
VTCARRDHHATCWRVYYVDQLATQTKRMKELAPAPSASQPVRRLPLPKRLSDTVMY